MTAKKDEQVELLREILAELKQLNANLRPQAPPQEIPEDSEELDYFE